MPGMTSCYLLPFDKKRMNILSPIICPNNEWETYISCHFTLTFPFYLYQKVLAAHGAAKVSAYVTHGVFPKHSYEQFLHKNDGN